MAYQPLQLNGFTKVNESLAPDKIAPNELTSMTDMVLSKAGSTYNPTKRGGFRGIYSSASVKIGARPYWADIVEDEVDNKVPMAVGYNGSNRVIKAYYGGVWNTIKTLAVGANTSPVRYTRFNKKIFMTDLNGTPFTLEGTNFATSNTIQLERPDITGVTVYTRTGVGLEASKHYSYIITYADDAGNQSPPSQPIYIAFPPASAYQVRLNNVPAPTDTRVTKMIVYRTDSDGKVFYQHSTIEKTSSIFIDNKTFEEFEDSGATIIFQRAPKKSLYVATHRDRVWWGNNTIELSNPYSPPFIQHTTPTAVTSWTAQPNIAKQDGTGLTSVTYMTQGASLTNELGTLGLETGKYYKWYVYAKSIKGEWSKDRMVVIGGTYTSNKYPFAFPCWSAMIGASSLVEKDCSMIKVFRTKACDDLETAQDSTTLYEVGTFDTAAKIGFQLEITYSFYGDRIFVDVTDDTALTVAFVAPTNSDETLNSHVIFSDLAKPNNYIYGDIRPIDGDNAGQITGIFDDGNGLVIFKERAIYKIFTTGSKHNWELVKLVENIGCTDPYSLAKAGNAYFFRFGKTFYVWQSGAQPQEISKDIKVTTQKYAITYAAVATERFYAVSAGYNIGVGIVRNLLLYDFAVQCWYNFPLNSTSVSEVLAIDRFADPIYGTTNTTSFNNLIMAKASGNDGYLLRYDEANTQDETYGAIGVDISPSFTTKKFIFPDEFLVARLRELFIKILRESTSEVSVAISADDGAQALSFTTGTGSIYSRNISDSELHRVRNLQISVYGAGLKEFKSLRLDYRPERREYGR